MHSTDNLFQDATAEHQGKLAKEYPLTVSLPKDCNDNRDEKEINRTSKLMSGFRGWPIEGTEAIHFVFLKIYFSVT